MAGRHASSGLVSLLLDFFLELCNPYTYFSLMSQVSGLLVHTHTIHQLPTTTHLRDRERGEKDGREGREAINNNLGDPQRGMGEGYSI